MRDAGEIFHPIVAALDRVVAEVTGDDTGIKDIGLLREVAVARVTRLGGDKLLQHLSLSVDVLREEGEVAVEPLDHIVIVRADLGEGHRDVVARLSHIIEPDIVHDARSDAVSSYVGGAPEGVCRDSRRGDHIV